MNIGDANLTAFSDLSVANLAQIFGVKFNYNLNPDVVKSESTGSGTANIEDYQGHVSTGTTAGSNSRLYSRQYISYKPGIGLLSRFTARFSSNCTDNTDGYALAGMFNDKNGWFIGNYQGNFGVGRVTYTSGSAVYVFTNIENCSKIKEVNEKFKTHGGIDWTKGNVFEIRIAYLGYGGISYYIMNPNDSQYELLHRENNNNTKTVPHVSNPNCPLQIRVDNGTSTLNIEAWTGSMSAFFEANYVLSNTAIPHTAFGIKSGITTEVPVLSIRNKTTFQGLDNHISSYLKTVAVSSDGTKTDIVRVYRSIAGSDLTGASWVDVDTDSSTIEYDTSATALAATPIHLLRVIVVGKVETRSVEFLDFSSFISPGELYIITCESPNTTELAASMAWLEDH